MALFLGLFSNLATAVKTRWRPPAVELSAALAPIQPAESSATALLRALRELPPRSLCDRSAAERKRALEFSYGGRLFDAATLTEAACAEDGVISGILKTITYGIPAMNEVWRGDPEVVRSLQGTEEQPGDARRVVPVAARAQVMRDGLVLGVGLGRLVRRQHAGREWRVLHRYSPRNLTYRWHDDRWLLHTAGGPVTIAPPGAYVTDQERDGGVRVAGEGEWVMFLPYGSYFPWLDAPWLYLTLAYVLGRDAVFLRSRHAEVYGPTRIGTVTDGYGEEHRLALATLISEMRSDNWLVLPPGTGYRVEGISGTDQSAAMYDAIAAWAREQVEIGLTGNRVTTEGSPGFSKGDVQARIAAYNLDFYGRAWGEFECLQVWPWYGADNYGRRAEVERIPLTGLPEDRKAEGEAMKAEAEGISAMGAALKPYGLRATTASIGARAGRHGIKVESVEQQVAA